MEGHPGIVFRDGPSGRRAGLPVGPDVWEVIDTLRNTEERGDEAVAVVAEWAGLSTAQVRAAVRYFGEFPLVLVHPAKYPRGRGSTVGGMVEALAALAGRLGDDPSSVRAWL